MKITEEKLRELGFVCIRERDRENDKDGIWAKDGITLYQEFWLGEDFNFATRLDEDGEFKGGYLIPTIEKLNLLFLSFSSHNVSDDRSIKEGQNESAEMSLLKDQVKHLQNELKEAHAFLSEIKVPTNGIGGIGKRETLTLKKRLEYLAGENKL